MTRVRSRPGVAARLKRDADGLIPAVVQSVDTAEVLMVGWMDDEALHRALSTGRTTFWSRSRGDYWVKGETSGRPRGCATSGSDLRRRHRSASGRAGRVRACHTGDRTCFDAGRLPLVRHDD
ncbi:MAG: phosphoribosyl-AMP cyclohydrolase [Nocardioidaceae bacterium]